MKNLLSILLITFALNVAGQTPDSTSTKNSKAVQCRGNTKGGQRCKKMTKSADGYCFMNSPAKKKGEPKK